MDASTAPGKRSSLTALGRTLRTGLFGVLFVTSKKMSSHPYVAIISVLVSAAQMLAFPLATPELGANWRATLAPIRFVTSLTNPRRFLPFGVTSSLMVGLYFLAVAWTVIFLVLLVYGMAGFIRNSFAVLWPLRLLRIVGTLSTSVAFIPLVSMLASPFTCEETGQAAEEFWFKAGYACGGPAITLLRVLSTLLIAILIFMCGCFSLVFFDSQPLSRNLMARAHGRIDLVQLAIQLVLVFFINIFAWLLNPWFLVAVMILCGMVQATAYLAFMPFYDHRMNTLVVASAFVFVYCVFCLIVNLAYAGTDAALMFFVGAPMAAIVGAYAADWRAARLLHMPAARLSNVYEVELKARYMLHAAIWGHHTDKSRPTLSDRSADVWRASAPAHSGARDVPGGGTASADAEAAGRRGHVLEDADLNDDMETQLAAARKLLTPDVLTEVHGMYRAASSRFRSSAILHVFFARFYSAFQGNKHMQMSHLLQAERRRPPIDVAFLVFQARKLAEDDTGGGTHLTALNRVTFEKYAADARRCVLRAAGKQAAFWGELLEGRPDLTKLHRLSSEMNANIEEAERAFAELFAINPHSLIIMRLYAAFNLLVTCNTDKANVLLAEADRIEDQRSKDHRHEGSGKLMLLDESSLDIMADNTAVLTVGGLMRNLGQIQSMNSAACKLLGYSRLQLERRSVFTLLPSPLDTYHEETLRQYVATGEGRVVDVNLATLALNKAGVAIPVLMCVRESPPDDGQPAFIVLLRELRMDTQMILMNRDFVLTAATALALEALGVEPGAFTGAELSMSDFVQDWDAVLPELQKGVPTMLRIEKQRHASPHHAATSDGRELTMERIGTAASWRRKSGAPTDAGSEGGECSDASEELDAATSPRSPRHAEPSAHGAADAAAQSFVWVRAIFQRITHATNPILALHFTIVHNLASTAVQHAELRLRQAVEMRTHRARGSLSSTPFAAGSTHTGAMLPAAASHLGALPQGRVTWQSPPDKGHSGEEPDVPHAGVDDLVESVLFARTVPQATKVTQLTNEAWAESVRVAPADQTAQMDGKQEIAEGMAAPPQHDTVQEFDTSMATDIDNHEMAPAAARRSLRGVASTLAPVLLAIQTPSAPGVRKGSGDAVQRARSGDLGHAAARNGNGGGGDEVVSRRDGDGSMSSRSSATSKAMSRLRRTLLSPQQHLLPGLRYLRIVGVAITLVAAALAATNATITINAFAGYLGNVVYVQQGELRMWVSFDVILSIQELLFMASRYIRHDPEAEQAARNAILGNITDFSGLHRHMYSHVQSLSVQAEYTRRFISVRRFDTARAGPSGEIQVLNLYEAGNAFASIATQFAAKPIANMSLADDFHAKYIFLNMMPGGNAHEMLHRSMELGFSLSTATQANLLRNQTIIYASMMLTLFIIGVCVFVPILHVVERAKDVISIRFVELPIGVRRLLWVQAVRRVRTLRRNYVSELDDDEDDGSSEDGPGAAADPLAAATDGQQLFMDIPGMQDGNEGQDISALSGDLDEDDLDWNNLLKSKKLALRLSSRSAGSIKKGAQRAPFRKSIRGFFVLLLKFVGPLLALMAFFSTSFAVSYTTLDKTLLTSAAAAAAGQRGACSHELVMDLQKLMSTFANREYVTQQHRLVVDSAACVEYHIQLLAYGTDEPAWGEYAPFTPPVETGTNTYMDSALSAAVYTALFSDACPYLVNIARVPATLERCRSFGGGVLTQGLIAATEEYLRRARSMADRRLRARLLHGDSRVHGFIIDASQYNYSADTCGAEGCEAASDFQFGAVLPPPVLPDPNYGGDVHDSWLVSGAPPGTRPYSLETELQSADMAWLRDADALYISPGFQSITNQYNAAIKSEIDTFIVFQITFTVVCLSFFVLFQACIFLPNVTAVNRDLNTKRAMLLYMPPEIIAKVKSLRALVNDILASSTEGDSRGPGFGAWSTATRRVHPATSTAEPSAAEAVPAGMSLLTRTRSFHNTERSVKLTAVEL